MTQLFQSQKRLLKWRQSLVKIFCQSAQNFVVFKLYDFVQISNSRGLIIKKCMDKFKTFNVRISQSNIKYPIGKSIFEANLPLKLFPSAIANADI